MVDNAVFDLCEGMFIYLITVITDDTTNTNAITKCSLCNGVLSCE